MPGNVMIAGNDWFVLDSTNAVRGDPLADVAMTVFHDWTVIAAAVRLTYGIESERAMLMHRLDEE